jgi:hypothetical protein
MEVLELDLTADRSRHAFAGELHRSFRQRHVKYFVGCIPLDHMPSRYRKPMLNGAASRPTASSLVGQADYLPADDGRPL